ncbi:chitin deacetylase [Dendrothele bispora CBS 962.96]|uniref:chitin deacetylase n=1 Tax=Dendrothele bispora (strain CBS 962.96) TaxID=1314807 RepID=A0A4S8LTT7_DENBC|nr:chitin deacetylase [Dendrothele bispora CBS 962.96]
MGMTSGATQALTTTYAPGSTPSYSHAPALPSASFVFSPNDWPAQDKLPPTDSDEVQEWLKELDGWDIPDIGQTADGTCVGDPAAAQQAQSRGWWTCGGWTKDTDILACPDKLTWGVSFDDGPAPYTTKLLKYLDEKDISATFFVVGSRVIERPAVLIEEYMGGHEISVHTWSHPHLTTLTNEEIVAELGWTRKAIKTVLGVTPTTMRPPYGDIDDRVRAISLAMGMTPIIWTRTPAGVSFDTFDWEVAGGLLDAPTQYQAFQNILGNASEIDTGFIVLQHDLYEVTVDLAVGYTLDAARTHNPPFSLKPIGECYGIPTSDLYRESNTNTTFPFTNTSSSVDVDGDGNAETQSGVSSGGKNSAVALSTSFYSALSLAGFAVLGAIL